VNPEIEDIGSLKNSKRIGERLPEMVTRISWYEIVLITEVCSNTLSIETTTI
jgi:uncharacterized membrane protein